MSAHSPFHSSRGPATRGVVMLTRLLMLLGLSLLLPLQAHASSFPRNFTVDSSHGQPATCGDPSTPIHEIQGSGTVSPMVGELVVIEGVVVGDFQNNDQPDDGNLNGFYVQEADANTDDDELTSEGIFVFAPDAPDVSTGNAVRVSGTVGEQVTSGGASSMTRLASVTDVTICATTVPLPALVDVTLPVSAISDFERYEGMRVRFPQELVISEYFNFDRFGEIVLALPLPEQERLQQPTSIEEPGPGAAALAAINSLRRILLDDGRTTQNPDPAIHPNGEIFNLENRFRGGDLLVNTTGVIDESFGVYRIQPTEWGEYIATNPRPEAPADVGGALSVAAFNVLNYFTTIDEGQNNCGPSGDMECRGADTPEEFVRQRTKIIAALAEIDADIVGLMEIENNPVESVQDLVDGLNEEMGAGTYAFVDTGTIGTDAIKLALIYKPGTVSPVGDFALLTSAVDPRFDDSLNRPVLAQAFRELATEGVLTVAVNHLKSKGSACGEGDDDPLQGNCNGTRARAAAAMVDWLAADPTGSGDPDALIIGDLNAYDKEDPIDVLRAGVDGVEGTGDDYVDLIHQYLGELAYTYVFDGQVGYLDYALAGSSLVPQVTGTTIWHINADEPDILDYDMSFKQPPQAALYEPNAYRSSDHDPVIVGLALTAEPTAVQVATLTASQRTTLPLVALTCLLLAGTAAILVRRRR
jgi:uncharacterized protein